jgi:hypothetical protein
MVAGTVDWRAAHSRRANRFCSRGRDKTAKPFLARQKLFDWLKIILMIVKSYAIYR